MRFFYQTKQHIKPTQCKNYLKRKDSKTCIETRVDSNYREKKQDDSYCETSNSSDISEYSKSSFISESSDRCTKDSDMKIIKKRRVFKHNPGGHSDPKGECQLESCMEVDLSSSVTGVNIDSPQGLTCIAFERCCCQKGKCGGAKPDDKKETKNYCLKKKHKVTKRKTRKSKRRKKTALQLQCVNDDDSEALVPISSACSNTNIPYDIPYDDE